MISRSSDLLFLFYLSNVVICLCVNSSSLVAVFVLSIALPSTLVCGKVLVRQNFTKFLTEQVFFFFMHLWVLKHIFSRNIQFKNKFVLGHVALGLLENVEDPKPKPYRYIVQITGSLNEKYVVNIILVVNNSSCLKFQA